MLPKKAVQEFQKIYRDEFNSEISYEEAVKQANDLIQLFKILSQSSIFVRSVGLTKKSK